MNIKQEPGLSDGSHRVMPQVQPPSQQQQQQGGGNPSIGHHRLRQYPPHHQQQQGLYGQQQQVRVAVSGPFARPQPPISSGVSSQPHQPQPQRQQLHNLLSGQTTVQQQQQQFVPRQQNSQNILSAQLQHPQQTVPPNQQQQQNPQNILSNQLQQPLQLKQEQQQQPNIRLVPRTNQNTAQICSTSFLARFGTEIVHDIMQNTLDLFQILRIPIQVRAPITKQEEKKHQVAGLAKIITGNILKLRAIYKKVDEQFDDPKREDSINSLQVIESLIPLADEDMEDAKEWENLDPKVVDHQLKKEDSNDESDEKKENEKSFESEKIINHNPDWSGFLSRLSEDQRKSNPKLVALEKEYQDLLELDQLKSRQIKEIIDRLRQLVWDINTMMASRKHTTSS